MGSHHHGMVGFRVQIPAAPVSGTSFSFRSKSRVFLGIIPEFSQLIAGGRSLSIESARAGSGGIFGAIAGGGAFGSTLGGLLAPFIGWRGLFALAALSGVVRFFISLNLWKNLKHSPATAHHRSMREIFAGYFDLLRRGRAACRGAGNLCMCSGGIVGFWRCAVNRFAQKETHGWPSVGF